MLTRGIQLPPEEKEGRKGGAGPTLGRYFLINNNVVVNAPVRRGEKATQFQSIKLRAISENRFQVLDFGEKPYEITSVNLPHFYQEQLPDGTPMAHIALVHGTDCLATTLVQHCDYFNQGLECRFCSIPLSLQLDQTILRKTPEQFLKVLQAAQREERATHLTLTMGSPARPDRGANDYVKFVSAIRKHSTIPIHVQLEPPESPEHLQALKIAGVDTVGIHLEIYNDELRKKYCPGKFQHARFSEYLKAWREAVKIFGRGQVSSFILLGLGETPEQLHKGFKATIKAGVIPVPVPYRPNPGSHLEDQVPDYVDNLEQIINIYLDCARLLLENQLDPNSHRAGCIRCRGCTALIEAYTVVAAESKTKH